jgi:hypothetical protein
VPGRESPGGKPPTPGRVGGGDPKAASACGGKEVAGDTGKVCTLDEHKQEGKSPATPVRMKALSLRQQTELDGIPSVEGPKIPADPMHIICTSLSIAIATEKVNPVKKLA